MKAAAPLLVIVFAWSAAAGQPAPSSLQATTAAQAPALTGPAPAQPSPPPAITPGPTRLDQTGTAPDGAMSYTDQAWDNRIRASVAAAQSMQGPLDGRWILYNSEGRGLFIFQFVDPAGERGPLEGVWRDLSRPPGSLAYGMVISLQREGANLTAAFAPHSPGPLVSLNLQGLGDGRWTGEMTDNGARVPVTLRRP